MPFDRSSRIAAGDSRANPHLEVLQALQNARQLETSLAAGFTITGCSEASDFALAFVEEASFGRLVGKEEEGDSSHRDGGSTCGRIR